MKTSKVAVNRPKRWFENNKTIAALVVGLSLIIYVLLNSQWLIAQIRFRTYKAPQTTIVNASVTDDKNTASTYISIHSIQVKAPVITDQPSTADSDVQYALRSGVLLYGGSAEPGTKGNTIIVGHSSGSVWAKGDYKWIFSMLEKLKPGDKIVVHHNGLPYTYTVRDSVVVSPDDRTVLGQTESPLLTLVTCTPVGTNTNRLIVKATLDTVLPVSKFL